MIQVSYNVSYPNLTAAEEARLALKIASEIQHHIANICCGFIKDAVPPETDGNFLLSTKLDVEGGTSVVLDRSSLPAKLVAGNGHE